MSLRSKPGYKYICQQPITLPVGLEIILFWCQASFPNVIYEQIKTLSVTHL